MTSKEKARILSKSFFIAGHGNFDITLEDTARVIEILERSEDLENDLAQLYEKLYQQRMG